MFGKTDLREARVIK